MVNPNYLPYALYIGHLLLDKCKNYITVKESECQIHEIHDSEITLFKKVAQDQ